MNLEVFKTLTVLYVEDEKLLRESIYDNLVHFLKEVLVATDGKEGLELFFKNRDKIDIIISDISMPNMTGIEMNDAIRKVDTEVPIIYTTAFSDLDFMKKTIAQSITAYIIKPIDFELLIKAIAKASLKVENKRLTSSLKEMNEKLEEKVRQKTEKIRAANKELQRQLYSDSLTLLKNRKAFFRDVKECKDATIILIDIDSFKTINDLYGEKIGNTVLIFIADLLKEKAQEHDCRVYRTGSDEFILLKQKVSDESICTKHMESISKIIEDTPIYLKKYNIHLRISVTIGISLGSESSFTKADMALKRAKLDKKRYCFYIDEYNLESEYVNDIKWTAIIEKALKEGNITPFYQPIVDSEENIIKYESLIRIIDGDTVHTPFFFLDIAKKVKLYEALEKSVLRRAFDIAKEKQVCLSVNVSIEDILNNKFIDFLIQELQEKDIASLIVFEILEDESVEDYEKVADFILQVKNLGAKIAIDDFGSGYSNFSYLLNLKPDYIKLDGSFIKNIDTDKNSYLIAKTINDFAHSLGIKTIAEYVHSKDVFEVVKELGIDEFQGYYFSEPQREF